MFIIYDLVFFFLALFFLPVYFFKGKLKSGFKSRLGFLSPAARQLERPIWIHAVSVGEVNAIKGYLAGLRQEYPGKKFVISTVTSTGNKVAQNLVKDGDLLTYLPLDFSFIVKKVLKKINPCIFIIAETEIWPNLIICLDKMQIPVISVNARISDGSYKGYRLIKPFIRPVLKKVKVFCVQGQLDARRLKAIGAPESSIRVTGNLKFDIDLDSRKDAGAAGCRDKLWLGVNDKLLVCGSIHPGEEEMIFAAYKQLLRFSPELKLLIGPRHPERSRQLGELTAHQGFAPVFISEIQGKCPTCLNKPVFILDTIGELFGYYACADIVFIGGSLVRKGGHNILEPASLKKPVIFGPQMYNFRDISNLFLENKAGRLVHNYQELAQAVEEFINSPLLAKAMAERGYDLIVKQKGATSRILEITRQFLN